MHIVMVVFTGVVFHRAVALRTAQSPVWTGVLSGVWTRLSLSHAWPAERQNVPGAAANTDDSDDTSASAAAAVYCLAIPDITYNVFGETLSLAQFMYTVYSPRSEDV